MRVARLVSARFDERCSSARKRSGEKTAALILTAHGSRDPRSATVTHAIAGRIRRLRPELDVRVAFCEQNGPFLSDVLGEIADRQTFDQTPAVLAPLLLADAYHARVDIPAMITASGARVEQAAVLGEDPALLAVLRQRLTEAGVSRHDGDVGVIVAAVGSSDRLANSRTATVAAALAAGTHWVGAEVAFATRPTPSLAHAATRLRARGARRLVIAPWFLAPGLITDRVAEFARAQQVSMTEPLGSHNLVAATVLDRYEATLGALVAA